MKNKTARQSAVDVYSNVYLSSKINSLKSCWSFDRLRSAECGFKRSKFYMRYIEFDMVNLTAEDLERD